MVSLRQKVDKLLRQAFPRPDRVTLQDDDGIIGVVVSSRFAGVDVIDRQDMIWQALEKSLSSDEKRRVLTIVAVTPKEEIAHTS